MSYSSPGDASESVAASHWPVPPPDPVLGPDEAHVWAVSLDVPADERTQLTALLSPDERERAARLHFTRDRERWIVGRGRLRQLLARYLRRAPAALVFGYACACGDSACAHPHRKPILPTEPWLQFNVSHTGGLALIAVVRDRRVGIDLERRLPAEEIISLARSFCSPNELVALRSLPQEAQSVALASLWVHKEAYLKARGIGLIQPPQEVEFSMTANALKLMRISGDSNVPMRWMVCAVPESLGLSYCAALAVESSIAAIQCWRLLSS